MSKVHKSIYQLKITLQDSEPPIWWQLRVAGDTPLGRLHRILQAAMGWTNFHLHLFDVGGVLYTVPLPDDGPEMQDEWWIGLHRIAFRENAGFVYEYGFGDSWRHLIVVEHILPPDPA